MMSTTPNSIMWILVVFVGGMIVLGGAIAWAKLHNRTSRRQLEETERATRARFDGDHVDRHGH